MTKKRTRQEIGKSSKAKGARAERELCKYLVRLGYTASRGCQYKGGSDSPDVKVEELEYLHFECKWIERMDIHTKYLRDAMDQSRSECGGKTPLVFWKRNGVPWRLTYLNPDQLNVTVTGDKDIRLVLDGLNLSAKCGLYSR